MARTITHKGKTHTLKEWADKIGITDAGLRQRLKKGWTELQAIGAEPPPEASTNSKPASRPKTIRASKPAATKEPKPKLNGHRASGAEPYSWRAGIVETLRSRRDELRTELETLERVISDVEGLGA